MDSDQWDTCDPNDSSGLIISNLPLLFVNGKPTSLQHMTVSDYEKFIPFLVRCSTGQAENVPRSLLTRPPWWPAKLPFPIPLTNSCNKSLMVRIVEVCYSYHGCPYLLQFCSTLMEQMPAGGYKFIDNRDGTSSMYDGTTGKLLVTIRNENRDYDKIPDPAKTPQKKLLSSLHEKKRNVMVQTMGITDVYLCDKCDDEFLSLKEVQTHEKQCGGNSAVTLSIPSPELEIVDDISSCDEQIPFLSQFGLQPAKHTGISPYVSPQKKCRSPVKSISYNHFHLLDNIDVTSPFGRQMLARLRNYGKLEMAQHNVMRYEKYIHAPLEDYEAVKGRYSNRYMTTFRQKHRDRAWSHLKCFTKEDKHERRRTIATGLNYRSRCLLPKCKPVSVRVKRLGVNKIKELTSRKEIEIITPELDPVKNFQCNGSEPINNGSFINIPLDPLALPSTSTDIVSDIDQSVRKILTYKTVTVRRICRTVESTAEDVADCTEFKAVNGNSVKLEKNNPSYMCKNSPIEVIDLLSDDDEIIADVPSFKDRSSFCNGTISKNGHSHWSPKKSLELGRSLRDLTSGSSNSLSSSSNIDNVTNCSQSYKKVSPLNKDQHRISSKFESHNSTYSSCNLVNNEKVAKRQTTEVLRLKSDECRELNTKGLSILHDVNGCSKNILTRRLAKKKLPILITRNSQFIKPIRKSHVVIDSFPLRPKTNIDENGNSKTFHCPKRTTSLVKKKRPSPILTYGGTVRKKPSLVRELINLSQDECKEIRCKGFHPADIIRVVNGIECSDTKNGKNLHSALLNKPSSYYLSTKKLYSKLNVLAIDENLRKSNLDPLLSLHSETRSIEKDNLYRHLYLLNDRKYVTTIEEMVNLSLTKNSKPRTPTRKETRRYTHRQLIQSNSGMCILNYLLPRFR